MFLISSRHLALLIVGGFAFFLFTSLVTYRTLEDSERAGTNLLREAISRKRFHKIVVPRGGDAIRHRDVLAESSESKIIQHVDPSIVRPAVEKLRLPPDAFDTMMMDNNNNNNTNSLSYNIHECPAEIPKGYPMAWNIIDVLTNWNPDDTTIPPKIYQGLCTLDWSDKRQRSIAEEYRKAEVPFLVSNHEIVWETAERWSHYEYLQQLLKQEKMRNEYSKNNHMMFWKQPKGIGRPGGAVLPEGWKPPTENVELSYEEWYEKALLLEKKQQPQPQQQNNNEEDTIQDIANAEHWYFRLNGEFQGRNHFLFDELPIFRPNVGSNIFMVDPSDARGINCRLGSKGIIAELHYDFSRNWILLLQGQKRYILAHPDQCPHMELYPMGHPSARHSRINWSDPNDWHTTGSSFANAQVNEVVLQAGDLLYLPTSWFHFIVSLNINYQCNARSGMTFENRLAITECGFPAH